VRFILNVIWLVLAGFWLAIAYALAGILAFILIITIPFGFAAFRMAAFALWPFGRRIQRRSDAGAGSTIGNILWIILFGWNWRSLTSSLESGCASRSSGSPSDSRTSS
jgi:uncharacterized membrane protein YccF (DUF307 family)